MVNAENILKVADAIEVHAVPGLGFNMDFLYTSGQEAAGADLLGVENCGTVACIAGWAGIVIEGKASFRIAREAFGLSESDALRLFYATNHPDARTGEYGPLFRIQPDQAVRTLRHLAATGEVSWEV